MARGMTRTRRMKLLAFAITLSSSTAVAETLHVHSYGRPVRVEVGDRTCDTPCVLQLPSGAHRARIDGLDRTLVAYDGETHIYITPTRRGRLYAGIAAIVLGSTGLTLAGHWASPLEGRQRAVAGLGGLGLTILAIPLVTSSSVRVHDWRTRRERTHQPSAVELLAGGQLVRGSDRLFATTGFGFRPANRAYGIRAAGRFATDAGNVFQIALGGTLYAPRLPIVQPTLTLSTGIASDRAVELELNQTNPRMRAFVELDAQLSIEVPWPVKPRAGIIAQAFSNDAELAIVGEVGFLTRL